MREPVIIKVDITPFIMGDDPYWLLGEVVMGAVEVVFNLDDPTHRCAAGVHRVVGEVAGVTGGPMSNLSTLQTAVGLMPSATASIDNIDGGWILPPGAVFGLFCTSTPVACSAGSAIVWEEIPASANA